MAEKPQISIYEPPAGWRDFAHRRTEFLFRFMQYRDLPIRDALASAYGQGIADAVQAIENRGGKLPPSIANAGTK